MWGCECVGGGVTVSDCFYRYELTHSEYIEKLPAGKHSTKGLGRTAPNPAGNCLTDGVPILPVARAPQHLSATPHCSTTSIQQNVHVWL